MSTFGEGENVLFTRVELLQGTVSLSLEQSEMHAVPERICG